MTRRSIDRPGVQVPDMCQVERVVLVAILDQLHDSKLGIVHDRPDRWQLLELLTEFQSGARDRLTEAEWREIGGGE